VTTSRRSRSDPQRVEEGVSTFYILTVELDKVLLIIGSLLYMCSGGEKEGGRELTIDGFL
jgi:hypothetical protein